MGGFAKVMNKVPATILRSPLHGLMSNRFLLLSFAGRKSGRQYTTPVAYLSEGDAFLMTTDSPWWKNLRGGVPVTMWVEGHEYQGTADAIPDPARVTRVLGRFLTAQPGYGTYVGLKPGPDGRMNPAEVEAVAREGRGAGPAQLENLEGDRSWRICQ